jgi:hypothetical protein
VSRSFSGTADDADFFSGVMACFCADFFGGFGIAA